MKTSKNKKKRGHLMLGCLVFTIVLIVVIIGAEVWTGVSKKKVDTSEGLEVIHRAEAADLAEIETKIQKLEARDASGEEERSLKDRFSSVVIFGDSMVEGFREFDILNSSSVISSVNMEWEAQIEQLKEVNPKVVFVAYCASDILESKGNTKTYTSSFKKKVKDIQKAVPEASIFINSLLPVKKTAIAQEKQYEKLDAYNEALQKLCDKMQIGFNDNSNLRFTQYYAEDGIHFNASFYGIWAERMAEVAFL